MTEYDNYIKRTHRALSERDRLKAINDDLMAALKQIAEGKGAYNRDPLEHASNTIDEAVATARAAIAKAKPSK